MSVLSQRVNALLFCVGPDNGVRMHYDSPYVAHVFRFILAPRLQLSLGLSLTLTGSVYQLPQDIKDVVQTLYPLKM